MAANPLPGFQVDWTRFMPVRNEQHAREATRHTGDAPAPISSKGARP